MSDEKRKQARDFGDGFRAGFRAGYLAAIEDAEKTCRHEADRHKPATNSRAVALECASAVQALGE